LDQLPVEGLDQVRVVGVEPVQPRSLPNLSPDRAAVPFINAATYINALETDRVPDRFKVQVRYRDDEHVRYKDTFELDVTKLGAETTSSPSRDNNLEQRYTKGIEAVVRKLWRQR
jgi:hypothetical protein